MTQLAATFVMARRRSTILSARDRGTARQLLSVESFKRLIRRERARSLRSGQRFCVVRFKARGRSSAERVMQRLIAKVDKRVREIDEVGWMEDAALGVLLPYTQPHHAWQVAKDVCREWAEGLPRPSCEVFSYPWQAESERNGHSNNGATPHHDEICSMNTLFVLKMPLWNRYRGDVAASCCGCRGNQIDVGQPRLLLTISQRRGWSAFLDVQIPHNAGRRRRGKGAAEKA